METPNSPRVQIPMDHAIVKAKLNKIAEAQRKFDHVLGIIPPAQQEASPEYQAALKNLQNAEDEFETWKRDTITEIAKQGPGFWKQVKLIPELFKGRRAAMQTEPEPNTPTKKMLNEAEKERLKMGKAPKKSVGQDYQGD